MFATGTSAAAARVERCSLAPFSRLFPGTPAWVDARAHPARWSRASGRDQSARRANRCARYRGDHGRQAAAAARVRRHRRVLHRSCESRLDATSAISAVLGTAGIVIFAFSGIEGSLDSQRRGEESVAHGAARRLPRAGRGDAAVSRDSVRRARHPRARSWRTIGPTPLASAAARVVGPIGRTILIVGAVISMFGYLSANVLSEPRGLFAFSRDGFLPRVLARVHPTLPHAQRRDRALRRRGRGRLRCRARSSSWRCSRISRR